MSKLHDDIPQEIINAARIAKLQEQNAKLTAQLALICNTYECHKDEDNFLKVAIDMAKQELKELEWAE